MILISKFKIMSVYQNERAALILIDPFNDFLSENGKLWPFVKETVQNGNVIQNMKNVLTAARKHKIKIVYAPHRHTQKGDYLNWKFFSP